MSDPAKPLPEDDLAHVLAYTRELWAKARGESFFITGGTGFFGLWLLESFARANDTMGLGMRAVVLTRDLAAFARKAPHLVARGDLEFLTGDLRTFPFPAGRVGHVIHAAAEPSARGGSAARLDTLDAIVSGTQRVLAFAGQAKAARFLFVSSGAIYGQQPAGCDRLAEDFPVGANPRSPDSAYAQGKREAERLCLAHAVEHDCAVSIARCFAFVGPRLPLDADYAIGNFIRDALRNEPIRIKGDGTPVRSYLYAADLAIWLWTLLFQGSAGRVYNVGSGETLDIAELARLVRKIMGSQAPIEIREAIAPGRQPARYVPSVSRAEFELGLKMSIPLEEAIRRTARWHRPPDSP